jgi:hypothetical protein
VETDKELALAKLALNQADLVIVIPENALETIQNNQQAQFVIYHNEVDPFQIAYINSVARFYVDEVNRRILQTVAEQGQANAGTVQANLENALAKTQISSKPFHQEISIPQRRLPNSRKTSPRFMNN